MTSHQPRRPRSLPDAGFTIVDVLVVALILSVVASVAVATDLHLRRPKTQVVFIAGPAQASTGEATPSTAVSRQPLATGDGQLLQPVEQTRTSIDSAAKGEVSMLGKEVATYFVDGTAPLRPSDLTAEGGHYLLTGYDVGRQTSVPLRPTVTLLPGGSTAAEQTMHWCVQMTYVGGTRSVVSYSASDGLTSGSCPAIR